MNEAPAEFTSQGRFSRFGTALDPFATPPADGYLLRTPKVSLGVL